MAKTRSQTGNVTIKKEEEDCKSTLNLDRAATTTRSKISKKKPSKSQNTLVPAQQVKVEEEADTKLLLQPGSKSSKLPKRQQKISQEQINQLIDYVVNDKMNVTKASCKVKISQATGLRYYNLYKNDPEKKIPSPGNNARKYPIQEKIENLIRYIIGDKRTIKTASEKANLTYQAGIRYYHRYLKDPDHKIPIPRVCHYYTQDQKNEFIGYVVNDKMNIKEASKKANMSPTAGGRYFHRYFDNQNPDITAPSHITFMAPHTQEQIKEVISFIVDDKMTVRAASRKANIGHTAASRHYRRYLKDNNMESYATNLGKRYTQDDINELIGHIVNDKMTIMSASKKANMSEPTVRKYYQQYLKENDICAPSFRYTQDQKNEFFGYIIDDKMTVKAATKKANIRYSTGTRYYRQYLKDKKRDASN